MLVLGAVLFVGLMVMAVLAVDFSRLVVQRNEIHTAADAGALAGAAQLLVDSTSARDSARAMAQRNHPLGTIPPDEDIEFGRWTDSAGFAATTLGEANAVRVTTRRSSDYLIADLVGTQVTQMRRTATAWAEAPVNTTNCVKPWGLPYSKLTKTLQPGNVDTLRSLSGLDMELLRTLPPSSLRFNLKIGPPPDLAGNFYALEMPNPDKGCGGACLYDWNIGTCNRTMIGPGTVLSTETGNMSGPTISGAGTLCQPLLNHQCFNADGTLGVPIKAVFWLPPSGGCTGKCDVTVKIVGSFVVDTVCEANVPGVCDKAEVKGYFKELVTTGQIGPVPSTIVRPILVQ
jgi:hypothetical protein